ncbi:phosphatase domain-containing protein [Pseudomaricurvus sp.]|uniref:phosphatase domain-containing protein n=1 Tax=Pseudomaricurvus sp. TaxID=2004510 RepID=UPI003F6C6F20
MAVPSGAETTSLTNNADSIDRKTVSNNERNNDMENPIVSNSNVNIDAINLMHPEPTTYTSGQPTKEQLKDMSDSGIRHVINLRPDSEMDWDERQYVESLGMTYAVLPIASPADLTTDNAAALDKLLSQAGDEMVLVHCASGNRVGAVIAIREGKLKNVGLEQAIETGKQWGLTKMEPQTREALSEN